MKKKNCIICGKKTRKFEINQPVFEHENLSTTSLKTTLFRCFFCKVIFRNKKISYNFFKSKNYIKKNNDHRFIINKNKINSRSAILAKMLGKIFKKKENLKFLEVGCGKGYLLNETSKIFKRSTFYGYDIGNYSKFSVFLKKNIFFLKKKNFLFKENSLDLIVISHTLNYFLNPLKEIKKYKKFLKNDGFLLILIPNIQKNIFYTLMSDQKTIMTKTSLQNLLFLSGFSYSFIKDKSLSREIICLSRPISNNLSPLKKTDNTLEKNLKKLSYIKKKILKIKSNKINVLGTNVNSAFIDEILKKKTKNFVSDFKQKNQVFRGKKIIERIKLEKDEILINCIKINNKFLINKTKAKIINIF